MYGEVEGDGLVWSGCPAVDVVTGAAFAGWANSANALAAAPVAAAERNDRRLTDWLGSEDIGDSLVACRRRQCGSAATRDTP